jgi:hypothetical protein
MSIVRVRVSLVVCAALASIAGTALAQVPPAPPPDGAPPAPDAPPAPPAPDASPAPPAPAPVPALDPATVRAAEKVKAAGGVIQVTHPDTVRGCRDLAEEHVDTVTPGPRGRFEIRAALMNIGRERGASHVVYSGHVVLADGNAQREHGHFYDCTESAVVLATAGGTEIGPAGAAPGRPSIAYSAQLELLPVGTLRVQVPDQPQPGETDIATAYGISANFEYLGRPDAAIGVTPRVVLGLKTDGDRSPATEFDLRGRVRFGRLSDDGFGAHVFVCLGASWIALPNDAPTSFGAVVGAGVGVTHPVEHAAFITVEVGYQLGFQTATSGNLDFEASTRLFHISLGIGSYL